LGARARAGKEGGRQDLFVYQEVRSAGASSEAARRCVHVVV